MHTILHELGLFSEEKPLLGDKKSIGMPSTIRRISLKNLAWFQINNIMVHKVLYELVGCFDELFG
jgi:hypothetical protein